MNTHSDTVLFGGTASTRLATQIAGLLEQPLGRSFVEHFPDWEMNVRLDEPVRGRDVFIIQSTCPPVTENLFELLAFADACRRSSARSVTAVIPYFGYARSDKRHGRREPIMASMVAELMQAVGISHVLTLDLHAAQIEGFFHIPVDSLSAVPTLVAAVKSELPEDTVVVSPDEGRVKTAAEFARCLRRRVAVLHKHRQSGTATSVVNVVGDVQGQTCLIIDDIISTGATIAQSVNALVRAGARPEIFVAATHGVLANGSRDRLNDPAIRKIFVSDSVPVHHANWPALHIVSFAPLFAAAVRRLHDNESLGTLYSQPVGASRKPNITIAAQEGDREHEPAIP